MNTGINFIAYKVVKTNYCEPDEIIGYFQTKQRAELERLSFIEREKLPDQGVCCHQSKLVEIEEIIIET